MKKSDEVLRKALIEKDPETIISKIAFIHDIEAMAVVIIDSGVKKESKEKMMQELEQEYSEYNRLYKMIRTKNISSSEKEKLKADRKKECIRIFKKYRDFIDISKYVEGMYMLIRFTEESKNRELADIAAHNPNAEISYTLEAEEIFGSKANVLKAINLLNIVPYVAFDVDQDGKIKIVSEVSNQYNKLLANRKRKLESLPNDFPIDFLLDNVTLHNIFNFCIEEESIKNVFENAINGTNGFSEEDLTKDRKLNEKEKEIFKKNMKFINLDRLILASISNKLDELRENPDYKELRRFMEFYQSNFERYVIDIKDIVNVPDKGDITWNELFWGNIQDIRKHFIQGEYIEDTDDIDKIVEDVKDGRLPYDTLSTEDYLDNALSISRVDIMNIVVSDINALKYFVEEKIIDLDTSGKAVISVYLGAVRALSKDEIQFQNRPSKETIKYLMSPEVGLLSDDDFVRLYISGIIEESTIQELIVDNDINFSNKFNSERIINLYKTKKTDKDESDLSQLIEAYQKFNKDGKTEEEQRQQDFDFINSAIDLGLEDDDLIEMYQRNAISLDSLTDIISTYSIEKLYSEGKIKYEDVRRLYDAGTINDDMIKEILSSTTMDDGQKIMLIASTFRRPEDAEKRLEFRRYLLAIEKKSNDLFNEEPITRNGRGKGSGTQEYERHVTDPFTRCMLMAAIEPEYNYKYLKDGHVIFEFPRNNKHIVEKLFMAGKDKKFAIDAATYILDSEFYRANENNIIISSKDGSGISEGIERRALTKLKREEDKETTYEFSTQEPEEKEITSEKGKKKMLHKSRINTLQHTKSWARRFCEYFGVDTSEEYSEEHKSEIKSLIEAVEQSWEILNYDE